MTLLITSSLDCQVVSLNKDVIRVCIFIFLVFILARLKSAINDAISASDLWMVLIESLQIGADSEEFISANATYVEIYVGIAMILLAITLHRIVHITFRRRNALL